ncbi:MAG: hypothetical protein PVF17_06830 [Ignavibacteria bacterium]
MAVKRTDKKGVSQLLIIVTGVIIVLASILVYLFILRGVFGRFTADELIPDAESLGNLLFGREPGIAILYSDYTQNMLVEGSKWQEDNLATWKKFLDYGNHKYEIINDVDIEMGKHFEYDLLVLSGSISLSDREIIEIKKFLDSGGSIFATSGTASYSSDGKWRGWDFFSEVFGVKYTKEIGEGDITKIHTLRGGNSITANIPTGYPLHIASWDNPIAVEVLDPRTEQVSFWYNYRLEEGLVREGIMETAGMVYGKYGEGRFVWMGFDINSVIGVQEDYIYFDRLFKNCINWLQKKPIAFVKDWPSGYSAAAVILPAITGEVSKIENLLPVLSTNQIEVSFYIKPQIAIENQELVKTLSKYGEVGALVDIGYLSSVNDTINSLQSYDVQLEKVIDAREVIENISATSVTGLLPYYGLFDEYTISAAINAGYNYLVTDSLTDRSVPRTFIRGENRILSITKAARDDLEVIRNFDLDEPEFQFYTYQEDIDRVLFEGGLYLYKMHPGYQCREENIGVVEDVIQELIEKKFWITTAEKIQKWHRGREYLEIRSEKRGRNRVAVTLSNSGRNAISNFVTFVDLNEKADHLAIETEVIGKKVAEFSHQKGSEIVYLYIEDLNPGESRTFYIDFDVVNI